MKQTRQDPWAIAATLGIPLLTILAAVQYRLPLPLYDYWDVLHGSLYVDDGLAGRLGFWWQPFVDQRMFFPKAFIDILARTTGNRHYGIELAFGFACQAVTLLLLLRCGRALRETSPRLHRQLPLLLSALLFWPLLLLRFQNPWYSTQYSWVLVFGVLAVTLLGSSSGSWRTLGGAVVAATVGALSHGTGLLLLPVLGVASLWVPGRSWGQRGAWWVATIVVATLFLQGRPSRAELGFPSLVSTLEEPRRMMAFALECFLPGIGSPLPGLAVFAIGVAAVVVLFRSRPTNSPLLFPWVTLFGWGVAVAAASSLSRATVTEGAAHHYAGFFVVVWVAVAVLAGLALQYRPIRWLEPGSGARRVAVVVTAVVVLVGYLVAAREGYRAARGQARDVAQVCESLVRPYADLDPDVYRRVFPFERFSTRILPDLDAAGLLPACLDEPSD